MQDEMVILKKQVRQLQFAILFFMTLVFILSATAFTKKKESNEVIRTKGIVIIDDLGRDRILIGAPIPASKYRVRTDTALVRKYWSKKFQDPNQYMKWYRDYYNSVVGMVVINEDGFDRIQIGDKLSDPNIGKRMFEMSGMIWNDREGWEKGGAGVNTNKDGSSRSVVGVDHEGGEAVHMVALEDGSRGLIIGGDDGRIMMGKAKKNAILFESTKPFTGIKNFDGLGKLLWEQDMDQK